MKMFLLTLLLAGCVANTAQDTCEIVCTKCSAEEIRVSCISDKQEKGKELWKTILIPGT